MLSVVDEGIGRKKECNSGRRTTTEERRIEKGDQPNRTKRRQRRWMTTLADVRRDNSAESSHDGGARAHGPGNTITKGVSGTVAQSSGDRCTQGKRLKEYCRGPKYG